MRGRQSHEFERAWLSGCVVSVVQVRRCSSVRRGEGVTGDLGLRVRFGSCAVFWCKRILDSLKRTGETNTMAFRSHPSSVGAASWWMALRSVS